ncbi:MAG: phage terminase small subunit [Halopseudomonas sp.]|uniref:phage terminase small subunit n=1 Tax=Halopseudomonas sp. TaxID=2901191 RepID=UPI0030013B13
MARKLTPAARHMARVASKQAATAAAEAQGHMANATVYEQHLAQLHQDRLRLKNISSMQGKAELKKQLVTTYHDYIAGVLDSAAGVQDEVFTTVMLWAIDAEDFPLALAMADYVLEHDLKLPDRFERPPATMVAEEIATSALNAIKADKPFSLDVLQTAERITRSYDMHDQARAKIHLAIARGLARELDEDNPTEQAVTGLAKAKAHLTRAIELHDKCGGKKDLEKVDRLLKKHADLVKPGTSTTLEETADTAAAAGAGEVVGTEPGTIEIPAEDAAAASLAAAEAPAPGADTAQPQPDEKPAN